MSDLLGTLVVLVIQCYCYYQKLNLKKHLQQEHSFSVGGVKGLNGLPRNIRAVSNIDSFKTKLKTNLILKSC